jgi:hypothetical protein
MKSNLLILIIFFISVNWAAAQTSLNKSDSIVADKAAFSNLKGKLSSPFGASILPNLFSNISVSSLFKEGVNGKIELQGKLGSRISGGLSIDQKIGKSDKVATPLDLSGISPGTTVEFNLQKIFWHPAFSLSNKEIRDLNDVERKFADRNTDTSKGRKVDWRTVGLRDLSVNGTNEEKELATKAINSVSFKTPWFFNLRAGFTKTSFSYSIDSVSLEENKEAFITPTFAASVIKALGSGFNVTGFIAVSYNYSESYQPGDDVTFSIPFGTTRNYYTNTLAFGKPSKKTSHNVVGEFRRNIFTANSNIAVSPSATFAINSKKLSVFLPIYFIKGADEKGKVIDGLQGGVRVGYITSTEAGKGSSFKDGFLAQLIISEPLDFLSKL